MVSRDIGVEGVFDLGRTVRALGVGIVDTHGTWWWAASTTDGAGTIALSTVPGGVRAEAWGPGADSLLNRVPRLIGSDVTYEIPPHHAPMRDFLTKTRGLRLGSTGAVHEAIVTAVLGQIVTKTEGKRSLKSISVAYGESAPGPRSTLRVFPLPEVLASLSYEELHTHGVERKRAATVIEVSRRARRLEEILDMDALAAEARLQSIRGVGPWTSGIVMGQAYGDRDALPIGDYHLPNMVAWALAGEPRGDDARMLELLEPYRPHRRHALMAIKQSGISAPKYGPRTAVREHL